MADSYPEQKEEVAESYPEQKEEEGGANSFLEQNGAAETYFEDPMKDAYQEPLAIGPFHVFLTVMVSRAMFQMEM